MAASNDTTFDDLLKSDAIIDLLSVCGIHPKPRYTLRDRGDILSRIALHDFQFLEDLYSEGKVRRHITFSRQLKCRLYICINLDFNCQHSNVCLQMFLFFNYINFNQF